jgi:hypothetical protein
MDVTRGWAKVCSLVVVAKAPAEGQMTATETGTDIQSGLGNAPEDGRRMAGLEDVDRNLGVPAEEAAERAEGASPRARSSRKKTWKTKRLLRQKRRGSTDRKG